MDFSSMNAKYILSWNMQLEDNYTHFSSVLDNSKNQLFRSTQLK